LISVAIPLVPSDLEFREEAFHCFLERDSVRGELVSLKVVLEVPRPEASPVDHVPILPSRSPSATSLSANTPETLAALPTGRGDRWSDLVGRLVSSTYSKIVRYADDHDRQPDDQPETTDNRASPDSPTAGDNSLGFPS
jgi:hypothetical protein